ncbi:MAG: GNAT family N-acetyltransferase [Burkholderiaceae bacterium]|jgi:ribosomal-protein-alanine N-acetyltransferase
MPERPPRIDGPAINVALCTARLHLEPLDGCHAAPLFDGMRDPAIYEWISLLPSPDLAHLQARWARVAQRSLAGADVLDFGWAVQRVADGAWIGKMDAEVTALGVATNVGYAFIPAYWGQGHATEAVIALSGHLRRHGVTRQHATVTVGNEASCRVLERAGFVRVRVLAGNDTLRGVPVDDYEYVRR